MKKTKITIVALASIVAFSSLSGCAGLTGPSYSGLAVNPTQTQSQSVVELGVVVDVKAVKIEDNGLGIGTVAGAAGGGLLGSLVGHGIGKVAAIGGGVLVGGAAGQYLTNKSAQKDALQLTIKKDMGPAVAVVQGGPEQFHVGERVELVTSQGKTRVSGIGIPTQK